MARSTWLVYFNLFYNLLPITFFEPFLDIILLLGYILSLLKNVALVSM